MPDTPTNLPAHTPDQLQACLDALGWTQADLGKATRMSTRHVRRWFSGDYPVPAWVASGAARLAFTHRARVENVKAKVQPILGKSGYDQRFQRQIMHALDRVRADVASFPLPRERQSVSRG